MLIDIAHISIPQESGSYKKRQKPWFNEQCKDAATQRKQIFNVFNVSLPREI